MRSGFLLTKYAKGSHAALPEPGLRYVQKSMRRGYKIYGRVDEAREKCARKTGREKERLMSEELENAGRRGPGGEYKWTNCVAEDLHVWHHGGLKTHRTTRAWALLQHSMQRGLTGDWSHATLLGARALVQHSMLRGSKVYWPRG